MTVTVAGATTNRVLCPTLAAEEARVLVVWATVRAEEATVQVSWSTVRLAKSTVQGVRVRVNGTGRRVGRGRFELPGTSSNQDEAGSS